jgi:hypothetical protein
LGYQPIADGIPGTAILTVGQGLELSGDLVESVITAVIQDRLDSALSMEFAACLIPATSLKVSRLSA